MDSRYKKKLLITKIYKKLDFLSHKKKQFRTLMYHSILNDENTNFKSNNMWQINLSIFKDQINYLIKNNEFKIYDTSIFFQRIPTSGVCVTFDDGHEDNYKLAAPFLIKKKIPFTIFVISNFIKNNKEGYMNEIMLKELSKNPLVTIGSHTSSHKNLIKLSNQEIYNELYFSKLYLEDQINKKIEMISYPFGKFNSRIKKIVDDVGYKIAFTSRFGTNKIFHDNLEVRRTEIWNTDELETFIDKMNNNWDWLSFIK